ncbi:membrane hypothetical protein [Vibrio nigripulchritudo SOn1]|uniref:Uncharacterized protein n=1 Tax=Vibrio nigripulchritudo SOn1 TaxID=1238450 RepID=A0AAV2VKS2_9VIBR|nr:membrane hypothetical protein [Vibrio nigripulchritudo SOn1]
MLFLSLLLYLVAWFVLLNRRMSCLTDQILWSEIVAVLLIFVSTSFALGPLLDALQCYVGVFNKIPIWIDFVILIVFALSIIIPITLRGQRFS